ncbi:hypothetical protein BJX61DRAFT_344544 [Aspergillus egyptiacus]|nr:hypothetical protein BJX61DRAFT_344544 [Aspergillus egyptiacus]
MVVVNGQITTLAMSAIFTPPFQCSTHWTYEPQAANNVDGGLVMQNAVTFAPACFPSGFSQVGRMEASTIYSPGWCPQGYTSADVAVDGAVTTAICCLSGFGYTTEVLKYGNGGSDMLAGCTSTFPQERSTIIPVRQQTTSTQVVGPVTMWAQPITVALESEDSYLFVPPTTSSTSSIASETGMITTIDPDEIPSSTSEMPSEATSETSSNADSAAETSPSNGADSPEGSTEGSSGGTLSTGAGIGIGVGVGVGGLAILLAAGLWFRRSQKARRTAIAMNTAHSAHIPPYYEEAMKPQSYRQPHGVVIGEMDGTHSRTQGPHELA